MDKVKKEIEERTFKFGVRIVKLSSSLPKSPAGYALASQVVRSGTSIGANIQEAQDGLSKKDFIHSMNISLKEARETRYWLEIISESKILEKILLKDIIEENTQLIKILTTIVKKARMS